MTKITAYGVRSIEIPYFKKLNKFNYDLNLVPEMLNQDNFIEAKGSDGVLVRGNCLANQENLTKFSNYGIKYVLTRTVGVDHLDLKTAHQLGIKVARVPAYSPYAVAELAMSLGMGLFRKVFSAVKATANGNFMVSPNYFSKEIHSSTVGIIGGGKIGVTEAKLYRGMGTEVLASDPHPSDELKQTAKVVSQTKLLKTADIVSLHVPFIKGVTGNLIAEKELSLMKPSAILINTARGPIVDLEAVNQALAEKQIGGYGCDVLLDEAKIFGHQFANVADIPNQAVVSLLKKYPNVAVTPHLGSFTEPALQDMITISYNNFYELMNGKKCENEI